MHLRSTLVLALPFLASHAHADKQNPIGVWYEKVSEKVSEYVPPAVSEAFEPVRPYLAPVANYLKPMYAAFTPIDDVASKVASKNVVTLGLDNWKSVLTPAASSSQDPEVWWVFVTGGNKTCYGQCDKVEKAWNESAMRLATTVSAPHLARLNCDVSPVLCHAWAASPPAIWHITRPRPSGAGSKSQIHIVSLNSTSTTSSEIMDIHAAETWKKQPPYEGLFHPFDGIFAQLGVSEVVGYVLWGFAMIPSWMFMLIISIGSRTFLGGRAANPAPRAAPAPAAAT